MIYLQKRYIIKLKQAQYHFSNILAKAKSFPFDEFAFELCAFIESARNITWAMQKEYANNLKFKEWYKLKQEEMSKSQLFEFFNNKRVSIVHKGDSGLTAFTFYIKARTTLPPLEEIHVVMEKGIFTPDNEIVARTKDGKEVPMEKEIIRTPVFLELESRHVTEVCKEYLEKLEKMVVELEGLKVSE